MDIELVIFFDVIIYYIFLRNFIGQLYFFDSDCRKLWNTSEYSYYDYFKKITKLYYSNGLLKQDITRMTVYFVENNISWCDRNDKGQIQVPKIIYWIRLKLIDQLCMNHRLSKGEHISLKNKETILHINIINMFKRIYYQYKRVMLY